MEGKGEAYGPKFTKGNVVGCGWNIKDGIVFFTMDGDYLGDAFKNVYGTFYPFVGANSRGASIYVNFGQDHFRFNFSKLPQVNATNDKERTGQIGHMAYSFASESILLIRHLLQYPKWKSSIISSLSVSLENIPSILKTLTSFKDSQLSERPEKPSPRTTPLKNGLRDSGNFDRISRESFNQSTFATPLVLQTNPIEIFPPSLSYSNVCKLVASLSVLGKQKQQIFSLILIFLFLGANIESVRVGALVEIETEGIEEKEKGVVIDYSSSNPNAIVFLKSEQSTKSFKVTSLRPVPAVHI